MRCSLGPLAQLGERVNGIHEVSGSIPLRSTSCNKYARERFCANPKGSFGKAHPSPTDGWRAPMAEIPLGSTTKDSFFLFCINFPVFHIFTRLGRIPQ